MSMNLYLRAELLAATKIGKKVIHESFDLWQTPTDVTRDCIASGNPEDVYRQWITERRRVDKLPCYAPGDLFGEGPVVGYEEYCVADAHLDALDTWLEEHNGWDIIWYEM